MHKLIEVPEAESIPYGFCHCGCGQKTKICKRNDTNRGRIKGEPFRYLQGHAPRKHHVVYIYDPNIGYGLCHCGCGEKTTVARETHAKHNMVKGKPMLFVSGHNGKPGTNPYVIDEKTECWVWQWSKGPKGYGKLRVSHIKSPVVAHRHYYELHRGKIPDELELDHLCRNRACVNPDHLEPVSTIENIRRGLVPVINFETAVAIKSDLKSMRICDVARLHGVTYGIVFNIKAGNTWKDA